MDSSLDYIDIDMRDRDQAPKRLEVIYDVENPERIRIRFETERGWIKVGNLAYRERGGINKSVVTESFDATRSTLITGVVDYFCVPYLGGGSAVTAHKDLFRSLRFYDWVDENKSFSFFESESSAEGILRRYFKEVEAKVYHSQDLGSMAGYTKQKAAYNAFKAVHERSKLTMHQLDPIQPSSYAITEAADEDDVHYNFELSVRIFNRLSTWLENGENFPFQIQLSHESIWIVGSRVWSMPSWISSERKSRKNGNWVWDYSKGTISTVEQVMSAYGCARSDAVKDIRRTERLLKKANTQDAHFLRSVMKNLCCRAFSFIFAAFTVMNPTQIVNQEWGDDWEIEAMPSNDGIKMVGIKSRASKFVAFKISKAGLPLLKQYLKFRAKALHEFPGFTKLFFHFGQGRQPGPMRSTFLQIYYAQVEERLDPNVKKISLTKLRAFKGGRITSKYSAADAASSLQNTQSTTEKHYTTGNDAEQAAEFTEYFANLNSIIFNTSNSDAGAVDLGACLSFGNPEPLDGVVPIPPSCSTPEGCLGCKHYRLHADANDLRKVLSAKYVINIMGESLADSIEFQTQFLPTLNAIDALVAKVTQHSEVMCQMVDEISRSVDDGYLTDYWESKLQFLIEIGVLS